MSFLRNNWIWTLFAMLLVTVTFYSYSLSVSAAESSDEADPPTIEVESGNPLSGQEEAITAGNKLYKRWCQQCHGVKLDGYSPRWGKHGADLRKFWRGYKEFITIVMDGNAEKMMPPHKEYLSEDEVLQIGSFIETKAIEGAVWK